MYTHHSDVFNCSQPRLGIYIVFSQTSISCVGLDKETINVSYLSFIEMFVCGNFTTLIPGLSDQLQEDVPEGRNVSNDLVVGLVEVVRDAADVCEYND